jgi:hypothetical protein
VPSPHELQAAPLHSWSIGAAVPGPPLIAGIPPCMSRH